MVSLALPFMCPRAATAGPGASARGRRSVASTRATAPHARGGGDFFVSRARSMTRRRGCVLWHEVGFGERAGRLPRLHAITRVESSGDEEEGDVLSPSTPETDGSDGKTQKLKPNQIQLPKVNRSAELSFTCDACGHRTSRMVNPHAYKKGTMFVQCAGCEAWHKIVDNLGLIYEFPEEEA